MTFDAHLASDMLVQRLGIAIIQNCNMAINSPGIARLLGRIRDPHLDEKLFAKCGDFSKLKPIQHDIWWENLKWVLSK